MMINICLQSPASWFAHHFLWLHISINFSARDLKIYPEDCAHCFQALLFLLWFELVDFTHIRQGYFAGTGAIMWLPQCQQSNTWGFRKSWYKKSWYIKKPNKALFLPGWYLISIWTCNIPHGDIYEPEYRPCWWQLSPLYAFLVIVLSSVCVVEALPVTALLFRLQVWTCRVCSSEHRHPSHLQRHFRETHMRIKQHTCPLCGRMFSRKANMEGHMWRMHAEDAFLCRACSKGFGTKKDLEDHRCAHSGVWPPVM